MEMRKRIFRNSGMVFSSARVVVLAATLLLCACSVMAPGPGKVVPASPHYTSLNGTLTPYLERYNLPALGAAVVKDGKIIAAGAVGTRKAGVEIPVTVDDRFHLGSDTKAITSLLAALFVENGTLRWDTTVAEVFPELRDSMNTDLRGVTLEQLLSHTSGMPNDNERFVELLGETMFRDGNLDEMRYWLVSQWVKEPLANEPGTVFAYSNMGFIMVGAILERISGMTWEELATERVFLPLGLDSAGFGPQVSLGKIDAPLGHQIHDDGLKPMMAGPNGDNPLILGPAGTAHMSLLDFARWAAWNAGEGKRGPAIVSPATLKKLHTPIIAMPIKKDAAPGTPSRGSYCLGWGELDFDWSPDPFTYHGGSNRINLAHILLQPGHDFGFVLMTNVSGSKANDAFFALEEELYRMFAPTE